MGPGNDVHADQLAHALSCRAARLHGGLDRTHVAADHHGDQAAADVLLADEMNVGRLDHGVGRLDGAHQPAGFNHAQCFLHGKNSFAI